MFNFFSKKPDEKKPKITRELSDNDIVDLSLTMSLFQQNRLIAGDDTEFIEILQVEKQKLQTSGLDRDGLSNSFVGRRCEQLTT
jgi:hypothetical protein